MSKYELSELQRYVLALLEEAGSENVATLINTTIRNSGRRSEVQALQNALQGLLEQALIKVSKFNEEPHQWVSLDKKDAVSFLLSLDAFLAWSDGKNAWITQGNKSPLEITLTDLGMKEASEILQKEGYLEPNSILIL